jgi:hypothetical protein
MANISMSIYVYTNLYPGSLEVPQIYFGVMQLIRGDNQTHQIKFKFEYVRASQFEF